MDARPCSRDGLASWAARFVEVVEKKAEVVEETARGKIVKTGRYSPIPGGFWYEAPPFSKSGRTLFFQPRKAWQKRASMIGLAWRKTICFLSW